STLAPDVYKLVVQGRPAAGASPDPQIGIQGVYGNFLGGIAGKPKTDYSQVLFQPGEPAGGGGGKSGVVIYPEYHEPRKVPGGFNPSDQVQTRVSRLYYYRDARRVAQIINRDIRARNKAGSDAARLLADMARQSADEATDSRRAAERKAVQAAQESRAAEK